MELLGKRFQFLKETGELGKTFLAKDWSSTLLGNPDGWDPSLFQVAITLLESPVPMCIAWGPKYGLLFNDVFWDIFGTGDAEAALGESIDRVFFTQWSSLKPYLDSLYAGNKAPSPYLLESPILEVSAYELLAGPIRGESGGIGGLLCQLQKVSGAQYQESEKRFRATVRQAPIAITILRGPEYIVEMANDAYLNIIEKSEAEFVGRPIFDALPEVKESVEGLFETVYNTGVPYQGVDYAIPLIRNGIRSICYFNFSYHPLFEEDGSISGLIATATEVTDYVKAKHFILESEKKFRDLVMDSPIPMTIVRGEKFQIEMANRAMFSNIWRRTEQQVLGQHLLEIFPELEQQKYPEILNRVYQTGERHQEIESLAYVSGDDGTKKFYLDYEYMPLLAANKTVSGIMITVKDVTERVEARKKIEESEQRFRQVADSAPALIWMTGANRESIFFNKAWFNFTGRSPEQELGSGWEDGVHPYDLAHLLDTYQNAFDKKQAFYVEFRLKRHDGDYRWISDNGVPRFTADGIFQGFIGACMDIHDQKAFSAELEKQVADRTMELQSKNRELERINAELQSFAYISSHDLQEPLRKIQAFASQLREREFDRLSVRGQNAFQRIEGAAHRMQTLIQDLLSYSRTNREERVFESIIFNDLVQEVENELKEEIVQKGAALVVTGASSMEVIVFQFKQLLHNILSNALKFCKADQAPVIHILSEELPYLEINDSALLPSCDYVHICIKDNGIGFEPEFSNRIFEVFQRLHPNSQYYGTGIGLAIVKKIVDNHDGHVRAQSQLGEGAEFHIYIPKLANH
ncbi:PAS domain S-box-containing protein [Dyadobacter jejuensis]|uniref:histidine kinase n=1 Tax=Dyadobacter jejuensis TaxID=1082580 RepID=A0A316A9S7_9BACT|nr:PAS domain S-box protein [Dyadobacter jejuensis]PWJ54262.1 PAS domain S-box-containing protein [Dyadobacter jejuensis]